jgi:hypothetical protein
LAQKQTWRPMKESRGPGYESTQLCPPCFWQRRQKYTMEKRQPLQQLLLGNVAICLNDLCLSLCTSSNSKWIKDLKSDPKPYS